MALPTYSTGTASVAAAGTIVTGVGCSWTGINVKQGDFISIGGSDGVLVTEVTDSTHLKVTPWPDAAKTAQPYIIYQNYVGRVVGVAAAEDVGVMLEKLHTDGLPFIVGPSETVPDPSYGDDVQMAFKPTTGEWWTKTGGVWVSSPGFSASFIASGTGAASRSMQDKARDIVSVTDFTTATQAATAVTTNTGGGSILVPNGIVPALPASYSRINFDYSGPAIPVNMYTETGPSEATSTRLIRGRLPASTTGTGQSVLAIESRPVGASINGPQQGSYGINISSIKQSWKTTTQPGEIGGITVAVRNGGISGGNQSDASALLCNVGNMGASGFACGIEGVTNNFNSSEVVLKGISYQIGVVDSVTNLSTGMSIAATTGAINNGLVLQQTATGTFGSAIVVAQLSTAVWTVDGGGNTSVNATTVSTTTATGALKVAGGVGVAGDINWGGAVWSTYTPTVTITGGGAGTATGRYKRLGKTIALQLSITVTTGGTALSASLPAGMSATAGIYNLAGRERQNTGFLWVGSVNSTSVSAARYDNSSAVTNGMIFEFCGVIEIA